MASSSEANGSMGDDIPKTKRVLPHTASVGDITLDDEMGDDYPDMEGADEVAVLGYEVISTTGEFTVPRDWLLETMDDVGLPGWMAPSQTTAAGAYRRAMSDLLDDGWDEEDDVGGFYVTFDLLKEQGARYTRTLAANVLTPSEWTDTEGGEWTQHELGVIAYDNDDQKPRFVDKIDEDKELFSIWENFQFRFLELFDLHRESHTGKDINTMFNQYFINQWTRSTRLRDAVYFVPATVENVKQYVDGFQALYAEIDDKKDKSGDVQTTEVIKLPVYDNDDQREMVQRKVQAELRDAVETAYDKIAEQMKDDETVAQDVAAEMEDRFDELGAFAGGYKEVIQTELSVEKVMQEKLDELDDNDDIVADVVDEIDV